LANYVVMIRDILVIFLLLFLLSISYLNDISTLHMPVVRYVIVLMQIPILCAVSRECNAAFYYCSCHAAICCQK